jgi:hypothetical protein
MSEAKKRGGDPRRINYTPTGGNVTAGQVVVLGNLTGLSCGIATQDIANNVQGTLEAGGGIYDVVMITNIAAYSKVYWDDANNKVTSISTNNAQFGFLLEGGTGANTTVKALHHPFV